MTKALLVVKTGELFRLTSTDIFTVHSVKDGVRVDCFNALLRETRKGKRTYDKTVTFIYSSSLNRIVDAPHDRVIGEEKRRARELLCWKFHRGRCSLPPYEVPQLAQAKSIARDPEWKIRELKRLCRISLDYLQHPSQFDRTKISMLQFDLTNVLAMVKDEATREEGRLDGSERENGARGSG